jgi:serine protease Do
MTRLASSIAGLLILSTAGAQAAPIGPNEAPNLDAAVFKVRAAGGGGVVNNGSAVLIAPGKLVTTCHVTRAAQGIQLSRGDETWAAQTSFADIPHDLCVLSAPGLTGAVPAVLGALGDLNLGDRVTAVGYRPGGKLAISGGHVKGLHPYHGAPVLQVSAPFDHGQSGGALFDAQGRLVGITAFKAVAGGDFHFALPLQWLPESALGNGLPVASGYAMSEKAFWERARGGQPLFLRAAALEADGKWEALSDVAQEWSRADYANPASWLALGRALDRLKRANEAAQAYARAALLGPPAVSRP